jgi:hypothetical protein
MPIFPRLNPARIEQVAGRVSRRARLIDHDRRENKHAQWNLVYGGAARVIGARGDEVRARVLAQREPLQEVTVGVDRCDRFDRGVGIARPDRDGFLYRMRQGYDARESRRARGFHTAARSASHGT